MTRAELVVFGASNASGLYDMDMVDYHSSNITSAVYDNHLSVKNQPKELIVDLSNNPELSEGPLVRNEGIPGDTVCDMFARFREDVVNKNPFHVFIWPGLNDAGIALGIMHNIPSEGYEDPDLIRLKNLFARAINNKSDSMQATADFISGFMYRMIDLLKTKGVKPIVGTIPPYSATLAYPQDAEYVYYLREDGPRLIEVINNNLRTLGCSVIDAHKEVVNPQTGLMFADYSFGVTVPERTADILHLNSFGQIKVARILCQELFKKPVNIVPPDKERLEFG